MQDNTKGFLNNWYGAALVAFGVGFVLGAPPLIGVGLAIAVGYTLYLLARFLWDCLCDLFAVATSYYQASREKAEERRRKERAEREYQEWLKNQPPPPVEESELPLKEQVERAKRKFDELQEVAKLIEDEDERTSFEEGNKAKLRKELRRIREQC